jgi:bacillithiol biosynthesis cysteine-adding enzyme BshC
VNDLFTAYLAGAAREYYPGHFADPGDRRRAVERALRPLDGSVAAALVRQNERFAPSAARTRHLDALASGAAAVVTGQQTGLFLGPLFNLYKAASAIQAARVLAEETGAPVVPVFWLQTEDHDLPEIAEHHLPCARGAPLSLRLPASPAERVSVAHRLLPESVTACLDEMRGELGSLPHADEHLDRLGRHYRPGAGWADAFAGALAELFAEEGLVLVDPRDEVLGRAAVRVHRRALERATAIAEQLEARARELAAAGFPATVHVRPGAPLSFFHPDGAAGSRHRLEPRADGFGEVGGSGAHTLSDLLERLEREPLSFSTSVLQRPILQDTLLPTAAYVGGPAEVAYFAQLAPLYREHSVAMPLVVPRARLGLVEGKVRRSLDRLGLTAEQADLPEDALLAACTAGRAVAPRDVAGALLPRLAAAFSELRPAIEAAGPGMDTALEKTRAAVEQAVARLAVKYERALLHRDEERVSEVRRLKTHLRPNGLPQERFYGFSYFAARYGERAVLERVLAAIRPFDPEPRHVDLAG